MTAKHGSLNGKPTLTLMPTNERAKVRTCERAIAIGRSARIAS
jgi:hypothetical protein